MSAIVYGNNQGFSWADAGGPARPIKFSFGGPRPGPARLIFRGWAAARPRPSHFQKCPARPGPAHHFFKNLGPAQPGPSHGSEAHETRALYMGWPDITWAGPWVLRAGPWAGPCVVPYYKVHAHALTRFVYFNCWFFVGFFPSGFRGKAAFGP